MVKKLILIFIPVTIIGLCLYFSISAYLNYRENYVEVYVASHNIFQRKCLDDKDLELRVIPYQYLSNDIYVEKDEMLGKYVYWNNCGLILIGKNKNGQYPHEDIAL